MEHDGITEKCVCTHISISLCFIAFETLHMSTNPYNYKVGVQHYPHTTEGGENMRLRAKLCTMNFGERDWHLTMGFL